MNLRNLSHSTLALQILTVLCAAMGGALFFVLGLPLPWMLGAIGMSLCLALAKAPLRAPDRLRPATVAVIGVMLGSGFTTETFHDVQQWSLSILGLVICVAIQASLVSWLYVRVGRMDPVTALFASMPGGVVEMMEIGRQNGGDERTIILSHAARIVLVVALIAFWFRVVLGYEVNGVAPVAKGAMGLQDFGVLILCGLFGSWVGLRLELPAPTFIGPMVLSAVAHMAGLTAASPPLAVVICAQVLLGTIVGCRFVGVAPRNILRAFSITTVATLLMLAMALGCAQLLSQYFDQTPEQVLLAYAPGGLTEMSLVSISMGADVAYIATHHLFRVILLLTIAGNLLAWIAGKLKA